MIKLQRICAWCKSEINDDNSRGRQLTDMEYKATSKTATHGMCAKCSEKESAESLPEVHEFSENIEGTHVGPSGSGSPKGMQLDLFTNLIAINKLIFCAVCFDDFNPADMGNDPRYCKRCEENLNIEWQVMVARGVNIKPSWVPRRNGEIPHPTRHRKHKNNGHVTPASELPIKKIKTMAAKGMKSNRIAAELIKQGYTVNYRTIAKLISNGGGSNGNKTKSRAKPERLSITGTKKPRSLSARS